MVDLKTLSSQLAAKGREAENGLFFSVKEVAGDAELLQVVVEDREELPIFISVSEGQILCIAYLFKEDEVKANRVDEMNKIMLSASISVPLSFFAKIDDQYVISGALAASASVDEVVHEIEVLSSNVLEAIEAMSDYLN